MSKSLQSALGSGYGWEAEFMPCMWEVVGLSWCPSSESRVSVGGKGRYGVADEPLPADSRFLGKVKIVLWRAQRFTLKSPIQGVGARTGLEDLLCWWQPNQCVIEENLKGAGVKRRAPQPKAPSSDGDQPMLKWVWKVMSRERSDHWGGHIGTLSRETGMKKGSVPHDHSYLEQRPMSRPKLKMWREGHRTGTWQFHCRCLLLK